MRAVALALFAATPAASFADGLLLSVDEREAFGAQVRQLLLDEPEIVGHALGLIAPAPSYQEEIDADLALINRYASILFSEDNLLIGDTGPIAFAAFIGENSTYRTEIRELASANGIRVALLTPEDNLTLLENLGLDAPAYVFPRLMVRGDVPVGILMRYIDD